MKRSANRQFVYFILVDHVLDSSQPINKDDLIKRMEMYKPGIEAEILGRYLELCKPFTRFVPTSTSLNADALDMCKKFNEGWHDDKSHESDDDEVDSITSGKTQTQKDLQPQPRQKIDFGGFLGIDFLESQTSNKKKANSPLPRNSYKREKKSAAAAHLKEFDF